VTGAGANALRAALGGVLLVAASSGQRQALHDAQRDDGCWPATEHGAAPELAVEVHALVCLALLADGGTSRRQVSLVQVERGIDWLLRQQDAHGRIGFAPHPAWALGHAMAVYAIMEDLRFAARTGPAPFPRARAIGAALSALAAHVGTVRPEPDAELRLWCELLAVSAWTLAHELPANEHEAASALRRGAIELEVRARERAPVAPVSPRARAAATLLASLRGEAPTVVWPDDVESEPLAAFYLGAAAWREIEGAGDWPALRQRLAPFATALRAAQATTGRVEAAGDFHAARGWLATTAATAMCACLHYRFCPFSALDHGR
jgi:hypothetical protein